MREVACKFISSIDLLLFINIQIFFFYNIAGRRGDIKLEYILQFATSSDEEPLTGSQLAPKIRFCEVTTSFLPTANTCINVMTLPYASPSSTPLPPDNDLFDLYDEAYASVYFGNV